VSDSPAPGGAQAAVDERVELHEVKEMHQPLPGVGTAARLVAKSLLVAVVLVMTLLLGQLVTRPAPPAHPTPQGPVTPPIQIGPSGPPRAE
jgi:hypothetical protein